MILILILYLETVKMVHRDENRCASDMFYYEREEKKSSGTNTENRIEMTSSHFGSLIHIRASYTQQYNTDECRARHRIQFFFLCYVVSMCILFIGAECLYSLCSFFFVVQKFAWLSYTNALSIKITHISRCVW